MLFILLTCLFFSAVSMYAGGPLLEANRGQFASEVYFLARKGPVSTAVTNSGIVFRGYNERISVRLDGALLGQCTPASTVVSEAHYLAVTPPISHVPEYSSVVCHDVYPGIDWVVRTADESIEDDWKLSAGTDARAIVMLLEGTASARLTSRGDLVLRSGELSVTWKAPQGYQDVAGTRRPVQTRYVVEGRRIALEVGSPRRDLPLVIDPVIDFSYIVNGNGDDRGCQIALDGAGNIYIAGLTGSADFETTAGAAFRSAIPFPGSGYQVFVRKLSPDGAKVIYSTYLGLGSFYSSHPLGMRVDPSGNVYLATYSTSLTLAGEGTPIDPHGAIAVYKLAPAGDRLIYGTRVLPDASYVEPVAIAIDSAGNAYVGAGGTTIRVSKIDPEAKSRLYLNQGIVSGSFGALADLAVGTDGTLYVAGTIASGSLVTTPGALRPTVINPQNLHGYLIRLKADGSGPIYSTYIAGDDVDSVFALVVDASGAAYVGGQTYSDGHYPSLAGTALGLTAPLLTRAFVMKVDPQGSNAVFTSLLPNSSVNAIAVDAAGNVYAGGPNATGLAISKVDATGKKLLYYSSIPPPLSNTITVDASILGMAVDSSGGAYLTGSIVSVRIPDMVASSRLLPNAYVLKIDPNPAQCDLRVEASPGGTFVPGDTVRFLFTIHNNGPATAENLVFSAGLQGGQPTSCRASGSGVCGTNPQVADRAYFVSIAPGGSQTVELKVNANLSPTVNVVVTATASTVTSDVSQDNNTAVGTSTAAYVQIEIYSDVGAVYTVKGATQPFNFGGPPSSLVYAAPNSQVQIYWPSPQVAVFGPVTFQQWSDGSTDNPRTFTVTPPQLSVSANFGFLNSPYFTSTTVANAGSYAANGVSPGELVTLFGFNLGATEGAKLQSGRLPTTLGNTTVKFDGIPAPLLYASATQINAIVPYEIAGHNSTKMTVQGASGTYSVAVPVIQAMPALFTANTSSGGQAAALNQDMKPNTPANPANPGDVIVLYGTGAGVVKPVPLDGTISALPAPAPQLPIAVTIGGKPAKVLYAAAAPGLAAGVIQINARIPAGIKYSHHVPVTWSAGNCPSQSGVTIAVNDSPAPTAVFQPGTDDLSLMSINIAPDRIAADSDATAVVIHGTGFVEGMVVQWNNQARTTQFLDATRLQVTLTGDDVESPELGSLAVWDASQTHRITQSVPVLVYLPLWNHDLIYDSLRDKIYVAVTAKQRPQGSSIAVLNPETGRVERWYPLEIEPTKLAISGDSQYLYVALGNTVRRINLSSWVADLDIPLGQDAFFGAREVYSMVTLPGEDNSLAVSFFKTGLSPPYLGTAVFDGARIRPTVTRGHDGPSYLLGGPDAGTLYGADEEGNFYELHLDSTGVTIAQSVVGLLGADGDSVYAGGLIYDGWGAAVDPTITSVVKTYDNAGLIAPLLDIQKVLILGDVPPSGFSVFQRDPVLTLHDNGTGQRLWSVPLPIDLGANHGPMLRWGADGVALRESQVYNDPEPGIDLFRLNLGQ